MTKQELKRSDKMNKTLDVWAIQKHPEELYTALENIKTDQGDLILFTNLNSNFQLNGQTVGRQFDTELYYVGKDNDALILLQKDGEASAEQIRNYLEKRGLQYHEVSFKKEMLKQQLEELDIPVSKEIIDENIPELWFAREEYVLRDALQESIKLGNTSCDYYPFVEGVIALKYEESYTTSRHLLDGRNLLGVITLEDKMILMIHGSDPRNLKPSQVKKIIEEMKISYNVLHNREFNIEKSYKGKVAIKKK